MENYLNQPGSDQNQKESPRAYFMLFKDYLKLECDNELEIDLGAIGQSERFIHDEGRVVYYKEIKKLKAAFESSFPAFCRVLEIGSASDRKDTINLFAIFCEDGFVPTRDLTNSIMTAFGKVDVKLASDLLDSFYRIFIPGEARSSKDIAEKLVSRVVSMTGENKERMVTQFQEMFKNTRNTKDCVKDLWCIYNEIDLERAKAAVYLLGVKGSLDERFILEWIDPMLAVGFGPRGLDDVSLATATCFALLVMYERCVSKEPDGLCEHHLLFEKIEQFIQRGLEHFETSTDQDYCDFVDVAIRIVYYICNDPLVIINGIIHVMSQYVFPKNFKNDPITSEGRIHRYVALAEVIIECHIYFYEAIVVEEIKKRKALIEQKKTEKIMGPPPAPKQVSVRGRKKPTSMRRSIANGINISADADTSRVSAGSINRMSRRNASVLDTTDKTNEMEEMIGAGDRESEQIRDYLDGILNEGLMAQIRLHVITLCKNIEKLSYSSQVSCVGLLTKVMCLNQQGMFRTMEHFLDLWNRTTCPYLTIELIKAGIYINMRFPNSTEATNKAIIQGLRHENVKIRVATLDFIIYLCLSEVIKVREYLIASSICLNDAHAPIKQAAEEFFKKMAEKSNIVNNCIPEIITFLTKEQTISLLDYQSIMKYLLTKIKRPTQQSGFIEKLISRFKLLLAGRQRQDVAYCLSLLSYNDKTFRIIDDGFDLFCDKLEDGIVYDSFVQIVNSAKKNCTKEYKITVDKFEEKLKTWKENCDRREKQLKELTPSQPVVPVQVPV